MVVLAALVGFTVIHNQQGVVAVQIGTVQTQDLTSVVTASGEIKPKTYVNIGANAFGKIIKLYVKEGQQVKQGQMLAQLESVQSAADVAAQRASLGASRSWFLRARRAGCRGGSGRRRVRRTTAQSAPRSPESRR